MASRVLAVLFSTVVTLAAFAAAAPPPGPNGLARVRAILNEAPVGIPDRYNAAEDKLVNAGQALQPFIQEALAADQKEFEAARKDPERAAELIALGRNIDILDGALVRLTWPVNPREPITRWMASFKYPNGDAIEWQGRQVAGRPTRLADDRLAALFPNYLFYEVFIPRPPIQGAYLPDRPKPQPLPELLRYENVVAVNKQGVVTELNTPALLEKFFLANLPVIPKEAQMTDAATAWLRLSLPLRGTCLEEMTVSVNVLNIIIERPIWVATGKAVAPETSGFTGELTIVLSFDEKGKVFSAKEQGNLQRKPPTTFPPSMPPGPGGKQPLPPAVM